MAGRDNMAVLMVDDDAEDCMLATEAFAESGVKAAFSCVEDGLELLDYLSERSRTDQEGLPDLILLDLNMPRMDGRAALIFVKSEPSYRHIPVVVLTTSKDEKDLSFSMDSGAESFITKPASFDEWVEIMKALAADWLKEGEPVHGS
jgi:CheY-like chemotaxis protein